MRNRAIFLDRDGAVVEDVGYARTPEQMKLLPGAAEAIAAFQGRGYMVVLITNQSGVGRGLFTEDDLARMHEKIQADLAPAGGRLDAIYFCPHLPADHPESPGPCRCRKPQPGMLLQAAADLDVDLAASFMVGDSPCDVGAGKAAGCRAGLVADRPDDDYGADFVVADLREVLPRLDEQR